MEYYWDVDPGEGSATTLLVLDGNYDEAIEQAFSSSFAPISGIHVLGIRAQDVHGVWGSTFQRVISFDDPLNAPDLNVSAMEYYWDVDPGEGSATTLLVLDGNYDETIEQAFSSSFAPISGIHVLGIRAQDVHGVWGSTFRRVIAMSTVNGCIYPIPGCTDILALNYDSIATIDDSSCVYCLNDTSVTVMSACDSYLWNGINYSVSGNYDTVLTSNSGCDSLVILNLTINNSNTLSISDIACDSYLWNGITYNSSGTYTNSFTNLNNCDSTVILNLTVNTTTFSNTNITSNNSYTWNNTTYFNSGTYTDTLSNSMGCDSILTLNLTIINVSYNCIVGSCIDPNDGSGQYSTLIDCQLACVNTQIYEEDIQEFSIFPNPSRDVFNLSFTTEKPQNIKINIVNSIGELVYSKILKSFNGDYKSEIELKGYKKSIYFLEIHTDKGIINKKLILQ